MTIPNFILNDEDRHYLGASLDKDRDQSVPLDEGHYAWQIKRFGWSPFREPVRQNINKHEEKWKGK